jgi:Mg/Co/Ni transporter MgtE
MAKAYPGELVAILLMASIFWASLLNQAIPMIFERLINTLVYGQIIP